MIVLVHDNFADLAKINIPKETYDFKCGFLY